MKIIKLLEFLILIVWVLLDLFFVLSNLNIVVQMMEIQIMKFVVFYVSYGRIDVLIIVIFMIVYVLMEEEKMEDAVMQLTILFYCFSYCFYYIDIYIMYIYEKKSYSTL